METRRVFLQLQATDYSNGRFTIDTTALQLENPLKLGIVSSTVRLAEDSDFVFIYSDVISRLHKQCFAGTADGYGSLVYCLQPQENILRTATNSQTTTTGVSDSSISDLGNKLIWWHDFHKSRTLSSSFQELETPGDIVSYYYNRTPASQALIFQTAYGQGLTLSTVGSTRGVSKSGSWESIIDGNVSGNPIPTEEFTWHSLIIAPSTLGVSTTIVDLYSSASRILTVSTTNGAFTFKNAAGSNVTTGISYIPLRPYIVSVQRVAIQSGYEFQWSVKDLSSGGGTQTDTTVAGANLPANNLLGYRVGSASMHFEHTQSCTILHNGILQADRDASVNWLEAQYTGNSETTETTQTTSTSYQLFSRKREVFQARSSAQAIQSIDLQFRNADGVLIQPQSGLVELELLF